jgi:hypothetical protein
MPRPAPPPEQTLRGRAAHKRQTAERRRAQAVRLDEEADALERAWFEYLGRIEAARKAAASA